MPNIVLDENIPLSLQTSLRELWYKVCHIGEIDGGITDKEVLDFCVKEDAILITQDKDFWYLLYFGKYSQKLYALMLVRYKDHNDRLTIKEKITHIVSTIEQWRYYTITHEQIKKRPLP